MGGVASRSTSSVLTSIATEVVQNTVSKCVTQANNTQAIEVDWVGGDVNISNLNMKNSATIDTQCVLSSDKQTQIQNDLATRLANEVAAQSQGALQSLGGTVASASSQIKSMFDAKINYQELNESISSSAQKQSIKFGTVGGNFVMNNVSMEQTANVVSRGIVESSSYSQVINKVANLIDQSADAKGYGLDYVIGDTVGKIATAIGVSTAAVMIAIPALIAGVILLIIIVVLAIVAVSRRKKVGGDDDLDSDLDDDDYVSSISEFPRQ